MALNTYAQVQQFITEVLKTNNEWSDVPNSPHKAFWELPYNDFVNGNVPNVLDPKTRQPMPILVKGNSIQSNIILALQGAKGTVFDPDTGDFGRMPANGPPFFTPEQIKEIADWIDKGCPE